MRQIVLHHRDVRTAVRIFLLKRPRLRTPFVDLNGERLHICIQGVDPLFHRVHFRLNAVMIVPAQQELVLLFPQKRPRAVERRDPKRQLQRLFFLCQR
jgi:hypothetical protein